MSAPVIASAVAMSGAASSICAWSTGQIALTPSIRVSFERSALSIRIDKPLKSVSNA